MPYSCARVSLERLTYLGIAALPAGPNTCFSFGFPLNLIIVHARLHAACAAAVIHRALTFVASDRFNMAKKSFDWWSLSFLVVPFLELMGYLFLDSDIGTPMALLLFVLGIGSVFILVWMCISHSYYFTQSGFVFRAGPFRKTVGLADIFEVMPTSDGVPKSRGAVRIRYYMSGIAGDAFMMIPRNQTAFLVDMAKRCPQLAAFGDGLRRAPSLPTTT